MIDIIDWNDLEKLINKEYNLVYTYYNLDDTVVNPDGCPIVIGTGYLILLSIFPVKYDTKFWINIEKHMKQ